MGRLDVTRPRSSCCSGRSCSGDGGSSLELKPEVSLEHDCEPESDPELAGDSSIGGVERECASLRCDSGRALGGFDGPATGATVCSLRARAKQGRLRAIRCIQEGLEPRGPD